MTFNFEDRTEIREGPSEQTMLEFYRINQVLIKQARAMAFVLLVCGSIGLFYISLVDSPWQTMIPCVIMLMVALGIVTSTMKDKE